MNNVYRFIVRQYHRKKIARLREQEQLKNPSSSLYQKQKIKQQTVSAFTLWMKKDGWALAGIIILIVSSVWYFGFYRQTFALRNISIDGTKFISQEQVQNALQQSTDRKILGFIPKNTYWTANPSEIQQELTTSLQNSYALEQVEVKKTFPNSLSIHIVERIPSITWITTKEGKEQKYLIDRKGFVTQIIDDSQQPDPSFPVIHDSNRNNLQIGWHIISEQYIEFLLRMHAEFPTTTGIRIDSYDFPPVQCQEKEYVAEKIFQQAQEATHSEELKEKQRVIQEKFQSGELTIDQSLEEIEKIRQEDTQNTTETEQNDVQKIQWETIYKGVDCDFVKVGNELHIRTNGEDAGFAVYMDTTLDPTIPFQNLNTVLKDKIPDRKAIQYIDIRFVDRVYFK